MRIELTPVQAGQLEQLKLIKADRGRATLEGIEITFDPEGGKIQAVKTDSYRLVHWTITPKAIESRGADDPTTVVVGSAGLTDAIGTLRKTTEAKNGLAITIETTKKGNILVSGVWADAPVFKLRPFTATFPKWTSLFNGKVLDERFKIDVSDQTEFTFASFNPEFLADIPRLTGTTANLRGSYPITFGPTKVEGAELKPWVFTKPVPSNHSTAGGSNTPDKSIFTYLVMPVRR